MNQQQLQTARAALWHQTAPLLTGDEAASWLDDLGLCLFLPRHAQLPAPAPSLVEAVHGAAAATPPPSAVTHATELAARLIDDRRAVPLNLLGTHAEQPDFLVTPEVLPWVAAVRGDRQWKTAPGGRSAPLVVRIWEVLDREGESTAVALRELLGRELTEAAVLRALIELWTTMRAMPLALPGQPTRWTLLKNRFPAPMAEGANTAQTTALSALLSIYLRSAVAATAEEAEIFLSPLTARSRIREVVHGMAAARQLGSMSVGSHTLLFVQGSLPEDLPVEPEAAVPAGLRPEQTTAPSARPPRPPFRRDSRPGPREERAQRKPGPRDRHPGQEPWRSREQRPPRQDRRRFEGERSGEQQPPRPGRPRFQNDRSRKPQRPGQGWQRPDRRREGAPIPDQRPRESRPDGGKSRFAPARSDRPSSRPQGRPFDRSSREERPRFNKDNRAGQKPGFRKPGPKPFGRKPGSRPFGGPRPPFPRKRDDRQSPAGTRPPRADSAGRFGKFAGKPRPGGDRPFNRGKNFKPGPSKKFGKPNRGERKPRKNRSQDENSE